MSDEIKANRRLSEEKIARKEYDVLLSYNSKDEEQVIALGNQLKDNGLAPWLDKWDLRPGLPWMPLLVTQIEQTKAAAIFIGKAGLGPWQDMECQMLLHQLVNRGCPVIPVMLEDAPDSIIPPGFLNNNTRVDFRQKNLDPLARLIWGITGKHPVKVYRPGILIASLGDSPAVVSAMYDLLTRQEGLTLKRVVILYPTDGAIQDALTLVTDTLRSEMPGESIEAINLGFDDANDWQQSCAFLQRLYQLLCRYEEQGESVYLSLAGGRKSMAALMAWVVPFFSCIKGLYHVIDRVKDEGNFPLLSEIRRMSSDRRKQVMHPPLDQLQLVDIPYERGQQISQAFDWTLRSGPPRDFEEAEAIITGRIIQQKEKVPKVVATKTAIEQFRMLCKQDPEHARMVHKQLLSMHLVIELFAHCAHADTLPYHIPGSSRVNLYSFTDLPGTVRPVFYIDPAPSGPNEPIGQVVICSLEREDQHGYRTLKEVRKQRGFDTEAIEGLPAPPPPPANSVLIVPLGESPMIATQLYTLLKKQELRTIHEIVLVYPQNSVEIDNAARIVRDALEETGESVLCTMAYVPGLHDIASREACEKYQQHLENEIIRVQYEYPDCKIDLALSGGRKGMTAMALFAARKRHIPYVYHTLIKNKALSKAIEEHTTIKALNRTPQERNDRLFLEDPDYREGEKYPYEYFALFPVPVFPADGWEQEE